MIVPVIIASEPDWIITGLTLTGMLILIVIFVAWVKALLREHVV